MRCKECVMEGKRSQLTVGSTGTTLMAMQEFYDEEGLLHVHDPNTKTTRYYCSNGHDYTESYKTMCQVPGCCGW